MTTATSTPDQLEVAIEPQASVLAFDEFCRTVANAVGTPEATLSHGTTLFDDLAIDSLGALELVVALDEVLEAHGVAFEESVLGPNTTVGDLYLEYCGSVNRPVEPPNSVGSHYQEGQPIRGRLRGRRVVLRPLGVSDLQVLYAYVCSEAVAFGWRYHGVLPSFEAFVSNIGSDVLVQYGVTEQRSGALQGLVTAYAGNLRNRHCYLASFLNPARHVSGFAAEAVCIFTNYLFSAFPFRKIYVEAPGFALPQYRSILDHAFFVEEGCLVDHLYLDGRYWNQHLLAMYPDMAKRAWDRLMAADLGDPSANAFGD